MAPPSLSRARSCVARGWRIGLFAAGLAAGAFGAVPEFLVQSKPVRLDPFAESPLQLNPPTFRWPAKDDAGTVFRVEFSRDPGFKEVRTEIVRDLFLRPLEPFTPGKWYWRVRPEAPEVKPWIGSESFTLAADLPRWPIAPWSDWIARLPDSHPRIYLTAGDLPAFRENARRLGPGLERWREKTRKRLLEPFSLESFETQVADDVDPLGPESQERKKLVWASKAASIAASQPAVDGAWLWLATGDPWLLDAVKKRAALVASFDPAGFITDGNTGRDRANVDFGNALLVHDLAVIYDLLHAELSPEERRAIRAAIIARATPIFDKMRRAPLELMRAHAWQHGFFDAMVGALAVAREEPVARPWVELALKSFVAMYPWYGGDDGGSQEGPRYYHDLGMIPGLNTLDVFRSAFGLRLEEGNPWFRANPYFLIYSFPPGSLQTQLGDANPGPDDPEVRPAPGGKARIAALHMAELYGNGHAAAYAAAVPEDDLAYTVSEYLRWSTLPKVASIPLSSLPPARLFADTGTVFLHSQLAEPRDNVRLIFHASPYGGNGHAHADQNSFHVIAYNEHLLLDSGYYTPTGDPHRQEWYVQTKAHSTLLVDGTGQTWGGTTGYAQVSHFEQHPDWVYFVGDAAPSYKEARLDRFDRHVVWLRGDAVQTYVIFDDAVSAGGIERRFDWLLHAAKRMDIDTTGNQVQVKGERGEAQLSFLAPAGLTYTQRTGFDVPAIYWRKGKKEPLPDQWHLKVTPPTARSARFVTVLQVSKRNQPKPPVRAIPGGAEVAGWRVRLPDDGRRVEVSRLP